MITLLVGENTYERTEAVNALVAAFKGQPERVDATNLTVAGLPDIFMGMSLFAQERLVIVRDLSHNSAVWSALLDWLPRISDDIHLVVVEDKLDKRTATYKTLKDAVVMKEFTPYTDRDRAAVLAWMKREADTKSLTLAQSDAQYLLDRVGIDQWQLAQALEKLSIAGSSDKATIDELIEAQPLTNVFALFEDALDGKAAQVQAQLRNLELSDDPYKLFGLLSSQVLQLLAVTLAQGSDNPAKDFSIHPYVAQKLSRRASSLGAPRVKQLVQIFADADFDIKNSRGEPWLAIERALLRIAQ